MKHYSCALLFYYVNVHFLKNSACSLSKFIFDVYSSCHMEKQLVLNKLIISLFKQRDANNESIVVLENEKEPKGVSNLRRHIELINKNKALKSEIDGYIKELSFEKTGSVQYIKHTLSFKRSNHTFTVTGKIKDSDRWVVFIKNDQGKNLWYYS